MSKIVCHDTKDTSNQGTCAICGSSLNVLAQKREIATETIKKTKNKTSVLIATNKNHEGTVIPLQSENTIGKSGKNTIMIEDVTVSKNHCNINEDNGDWTITDNGSMNGTCVNNKQIKSKKLENNDCIQIGTYTFHYKEQV